MSFSVEMHKKVELFLYMQAGNHTLPNQRKPTTLAWVYTYRQSKGLLPKNDSVSLLELLKTSSLISAPSS